MQLLPPQPVSTSHFCMIGDVSIHPHANIAPGVILQADPQSKIVIAAGACVGTGAVIQAVQGTITVDSNANLGSGVLILGKATIGANAHIGDSTTIINTDIVAHQIIPEGSLMGDPGRSDFEQPQHDSHFSEDLHPDQDSTYSGSSPTPMSRTPQVNSSPQPQSHVIGRAYVTQMLQVLFARNPSP